MKIIKILILFLLPFVCKSQIKIKNIKLIDPDKQILYIGIDNVINIEGIKSNDTIILKNSFSNIIKSESADNEFYIRASEIGKDTLQIIRENQIIFESEYITQYIGDPKCYFNNIEAGFANRNDIISNPVITCKIPDNFLKLRFEIISFKVSSIIQKDTVDLYDEKEFYLADTTEIEDKLTGEITVKVSMKKSNLKFNYGNTFTEYQIDKIRKLKLGSVLFISEIYVRFSDYSNRRMENILIKIK